VFLVGTVLSGDPPRQMSLQTMQDFAERHAVEYFDCELDDVGANKILVSLVDKIINDNTLSGRIGESTDGGKSIEGEC